MVHLHDHPDTYNLITAHHFIEHLAKDEVLDFLDAVKIALKPEGRVIIVTGNVASLFGPRTSARILPMRVGLHRGAFRSF